MHLVLALNPPPHQILLADTEHTFVGEGWWLRQCTLALPRPHSFDYPDGMEGSSAPSACSPYLHPLPSVADIHQATEAGTLWSPHVPKLARRLPQSAPAIPWGRRGTVIGDALA